MLNLAGDKFNTQEIFLQPSYSCGKSCGGCYIKENEVFYNRKNNYPEFWPSVIYDLLIEQKHINAKQVTLALDTLPSKNHLLYTSTDRQFMIEIADYYFGWSRVRKNSNNPEAHITVNCVNDLKQYLDVIKYPTLKLNLVSISNINCVEDVEYIRDIAPGVEVNWNILSTSLVKQNPESIRKILQVVDNMYLLLHKVPLGESGNQIRQLREALIIIDKFRDKSKQDTDGKSCSLPDLTSKVVIDHCITNSIKFKKSGHGCSSNISRFQIWPDGRVTGCAYNSHNQYKDPATNIQDIVNNLRDARNRYEFKGCHIPTQL